MRCFKRAIAKRKINKGEVVSDLDVEFLEGDGMQDNLNTIKTFDFVDFVIDGHDKRKRVEGVEWDGIVTHHTGVGGRTEIDDALWARLNRNIAAYLGRKDNAYVSAHYQIGRKGEITQIVNPEYYVAYHAGKSKWWNSKERKMMTGCNNWMIGIELLGDGNLHEYSKEQYAAHAKLTAHLMDKFGIGGHQLVGHEMVSPGRKTDPGVEFDWIVYLELVYKYGFDNLRGTQG